MRKNNKAIVKLKQSILERFNKINDKSGPTMKDVVIDANDNDNTSDSLITNSDSAPELLTDPELFTDIFFFSLYIISTRVFW